MGTQAMKCCPNPDCPNHDPERVRRIHWYSPHGSYLSNGQRLLRYRCNFCGRTFSETYFTRSWHLSRTDVDEMALLFEWCKGTKVHQLSKMFDCSPRVITNRIERMQKLAREKHIVLEVESPGVSNEAVVADS